MIKCFWWRWWSWMSPAGHWVRAGDSKRRMYSRLGKRKPRPLQSSSHELRHLWISHKNYHSRGKKLIKSQTTGESPLVKSVFESIFSSKGSTPALGSTSLPTVLFTRPNCWHLWKRHKKGGIFSLSFHPLEISSISNVQSDFKKQVGNDTVEGIAFSKDTAVIMTGVFVEEDEVGGGEDHCLDMVGLLVAMVKNTKAWSGGLGSREQNGTMVQAMVLSPCQNIPSEGRPGTNILINLMMMIINNYLDRLSSSQHLSSTSATTSLASGWLTGFCHGLIILWQGGPLSP